MQQVYNRNSSANVNIVILAEEKFPVNNGKTVHLGWFSRYYSYFLNKVIWVLFSVGANFHRNCYIAKNNQITTRKGPCLQYLIDLQHFKVLVHCLIKTSGSDFARLVGQCDAKQLALSSGVRPCPHIAFLCHACPDTPSVKHVFVKYYAPDYVIWIWSDLINWLK